MKFDPEIFEDIERHLAHLTIDEIKQRLDPLMINFRIETPIFDPGLSIYRARRFNSVFRKQDKIDRGQLVCPPIGNANAGRLNRARQSVFCGGVAKEAVFFEMRDLAEGDEILLSFWKTTEKMVVNNIGYTELAFEQLGAKRPVRFGQGSPKMP
jgi:hypothetical protein